MHLHDYIKVTPEADPKFIETWYLRSSRVYVTQIKNSNLDQIGDAEYTCTKIDAVRQHARAVLSILEDVPKGSVPTAILSLK